jgi:flagellar protein FlbD
MIRLTRLDGSQFVVNADLVETIEHHGDTVVTLVSGTRFVVREDVETIVDGVARFRAGVLQLVEAHAAPPDHNVIPLAGGRRGIDVE